MNAAPASAAQRSDFERLLDRVSARLESSESTLTGAARDALALAIVEDVAAFVLDWAE